jgi:YfiH family protein
MHLKSEILQCEHAFFTRNGGVSEGLYASLNFNEKEGTLADSATRIGDKPENILRNREIVAGYFSLPVTNLVTVNQVHENNVLFVDKPIDGRKARYDALVTDNPQVCIGIITADCVPILLETTDGKVVGAIHAGWKSAISGVIENAISEMRKRSTLPIRAAIGPSVQQHSYEVSKDYFETFVSKIGPAVGQFFEGKAHDKYNFDIGGFCKTLLSDYGVESIEHLNLDTVTNPDKFFSNRRRTLLGESHFGCQMSAIKPKF